MKFKTNVIAIGVEALELKQANKFILFGEKASYGLEDYSIMITAPKETVTICVNDTIKIGNKSYEVTAVGDKVEETFSSLGHCTVCMDGALNAELPGMVHMKGDFPEFAIGDEIIIG